MSEAAPSGALARGHRTRAGNAMSRGRLGVIHGALASLELNGVRGTTMTAIATEGGVAKATVYNHFRTKDEILLGVVEHEVERIRDAASAAAPDLADALTVAASELSDHPSLIHLRLGEPSSVAALSALGDDSVSELSRRATAEVLARCGTPATPAQVEVVLRWLTSYIAAPAPPDRREAEARALAELLSSAHAASSSETVDQGR